MYIYLLIVLVFTQRNEFPDTTTLFKHAVNAQFNLANAIYAWNDESPAYDIAFWLFWKFVDRVVFFCCYVKRGYVKN